MKTDSINDRTEETGTRMGRSATCARKHRFGRKPPCRISSLRLAAESFIKEWYGTGFALGAYAYAAVDGARLGTFTLRGGVFTHHIAYSDATQRYEVRYEEATL